MSQHDYNIANATFPNVRTDLNNALGAIATNNSGDSAPSTTYANQFWYETDNNKLYIRNEDNDAWIHILTLNQTNDTVSSVEGAGTFTGIDDQSSSNDDQITIKDTEVVINEDSDDLDFRIESNGNANMFFVNGGTDKVGVGLDSPTGTFHVLSTNAGTTMYIEDSHAGDGDGPELYLYRSSASPADNDSIGIVKFLGRNDNSQDVIYGQMQSIILDASDGTEDAKTVFNNMVGGSSLNMLQFDNTGVVINESSNDLDFRVESNGLTHALFVDGGNNRVGIGTSSPDMLLEVQGTASVGGGSDEKLQQWNVGSDNCKMEVEYIDDSANRGFGFGPTSQQNLNLKTHDTNRITIRYDGAVTMPSQPCVFAFISSTQADIATGPVKVNLDSEVYDVAGNFNTSTYVFTAPVTGKYQVSGSLQMSDVDTAFQWIYMRFVSSNRIYYFNQIDPRKEMSEDSHASWVGSSLVDMDAGDTLYLDTRSSSHGAAQNNIIGGTASAPETFMSVHLAV